MVCRRLKAGPATPAIPVISLTITTDPHLNRLAYAAGAEACLTKHFRREALSAVVRTRLQGVAHRGKITEHAMRCETTPIAWHSLRGAPAACLERASPRERWLRR